MNSTNNITQYLIDWRNGDEQALDKMFPVVYDELHKMAEKFMRNERENHTLQATTLINEAYLKLVDHTQIDWQNRTHFFGMAGKMMRQILVDHARRNLAEKRGGGKNNTISLNTALLFSREKSREIIQLDDALKLFAKTDERRHKVVELRFFGGLTVEETASVLEIGKNTVVRDWNYAKAWLYREIQRK